MPLIVTDCNVTAKSFTITFSDQVVDDPLAPQGANNLSNYTLFAANSVDFKNTPLTIQEVLGPPSPGFFAVTPTLANGDTVTFTFTPSTGFGKKEFQAGDWVNVVVRNVQSLSGDDLDGGLAITGGQVPETGRVGRVTRDVEDAISYPILTEEVSYRPSPVGIPTGGRGLPGGGGGNLGQLAAQTVSDVLGWKSNSADPKGFVGALTQAFTLTGVEGHTVSTWTPRTYAVQTDLGGGITGAQASLYMRAKNALDSTLPLLNGLYPLDPEADPEYVKALREMARSQMSEIVKEFGVVGLPSILRINTYFGILLGQKPGTIKASDVQFDPDQIAGTLGELRDIYGIYFAGNPFNNSVEDEQDITNFRVISDYMTSLMQSWIANRDFFIVGPSGGEFKQAFFGTQLVLISRQFTTIAETVNEVRFALDSVFIGPSERQTLLLEFANSDSLPSMFLEDILEEVENFAANEGPRLLRDGGKISVTNNVLPVVESLVSLVNEAHAPTNIDVLPDGFATARVQKSLDDLRDQLQSLLDLILQITQPVPAAEEKLAITGVAQPLERENRLSILGTGFVPASEVILHSMPIILSGSNVEFYSAQRIDVTIPSDLKLRPGSHDIEIKNPDGQSTTLSNAFYFNMGTVSLQAPTGAGASAAKASSPYRPPAKHQVTVDASQVVRTVTSAPSAPSANVTLSTPSVASPDIAPPAPSAGAPNIPPPSTTPSPSSIDALQQGQYQLQQELQKAQQDLAQKFDTLTSLIAGMKQAPKSKQRSKP